MATRKTTATKKEEVLDVVEDKKEEESSTIKMLMKQIEEMQKQINESRKNDNIIVSTVQDTSMNRMVKVTSMLNNTYNLTTTKYGKGGKTYTFNNYGHTLPIRFKDMLDIVSLYTSDFENCFAILSDQKDYEDLGIGYIVDSLITKKQVEEVVSLKKKEHVDIIIEMNDSLKESMLSIISEKIANGESYDFNMIERLKKETQIEEHIKSAMENKED